MTDACLDRFPPSQKTHRKVVQKCEICGEEILKGDLLYTIPYSQKGCIRFCEECFDNMTKKELLELIGGFDSVAGYVHPKELLSL